MIERKSYWRYQAMFGWLNLVLTAPSVYLWLGLPLIMRQHGWSGAEIGLYQVAAIPSIFKFLLAMPVERFRARSDRYRLWALFLCLSLALILFLISQRELLSSRIVLFGLAFSAALMATWADIPINALAIKLIPPSQRLHAGGVRSAALSIGAITGGGVMLLVQTAWGWGAPFLLMAFAITFGALLLIGVKESAMDMSINMPIDPSVNQFFSLSGSLDKPLAKIWTISLLACFPFIGAAWFYLKPLLLDSGFAAVKIAWIAGVGGGSIAALTSVASARVYRKLDAMRALWWSALLSLSSLVALDLAVMLKSGPTALIGAAILIAVALGSAGALVFGLMMSFTRENLDAMDYGMQSSMFSLSRLVVAMLAGLLIDSSGYRGMLLALTIATAFFFAYVTKNRRMKLYVASNESQLGLLSLS